MYDAAHIAADSQRGNWRESVKRQLLPACLFILLPLLMGASLYLFFRPDTTWLLQSFARASLLQSIREVTLRVELPNVLLYHLPDALWAFALTAFLILMWGKSSGKGRWSWRVLPFILTCFYECAQAAGWISGTFDLFDILSQWIAVAAAILVLPLSRRQFFQNLNLNTQ